MRTPRRHLQLWSRPRRSAGFSRSPQVRIGASIWPKAALPTAIIATWPDHSRVPPITRVYANLPEILEQLPNYLGQGSVTSRSAARSQEGTTFEASCYTDPLAIEHLTGSLSALVQQFGRWNADVQLRFTPKFAAVDPLIGIAHGGRTRMRVSLNPPMFGRFEGGTSPAQARIQALRTVAQAGYKVGLTIAPIMAAAGWQKAYASLLAQVAAALDRMPELDLTAELITHRFTASSKEVLTSWYPGSSLDMSSDRRAEKRTKFGSVKQVYDAPTMKDIRAFFEAEIAAQLPSARILYFT